MIDSRDEEIFALCREIGELKAKVGLLKMEADKVTRTITALRRRNKVKDDQIKRLNEIIFINHIGPGKGSQT